MSRSTWLASPVVDAPCRVRLQCFGAAVTISVLLTVFAVPAAASSNCPATAVPCRTVWMGEFTDVAPVYGSGDLNGDGADDLLLLRNGALWFWYGSPTQTPTVVALSAVRVVRAGTMQQALAGAEPVIGDFDGDGIDDVLWASTAGSPVDNGQIWYGTKTIGEFRGAPAAGTTHDGSAYWTVGDFDADGGDDVVWYNERTGDLLLQLLDGGAQGVQVRAYPDRLAPGLRLLHGDFDGNRATDLLYYDARSGRGAVWFFEAGGAIRGREIEPGAGYRPAAGDFDGDGRIDVMWYGPLEQLDAYWFGTADRQFRGAPMASQGGTWYPLVADFDGDHRDDVFWWDAGPQPDVLALTRPGGAYPIAQSLGAVSQIVLPDFDGDGAADVLFTGVYDADNHPTTWSVWWFTSHPVG